MSESVSNTLNQYVEAADVDGVLNWIATLAAEDSKLLPKMIFKAFKLYQTLGYEWAAKGVSVLCAALYATANLTDIKRTDGFRSPEFETLKRIITLFKPTWLDAWAEWLLEDSPWQFRLIHPLVVGGYCQKPQTDAYIFGMIDTLVYHHGSHETLFERIVACPDILQTDVWRLFEIEGGGEFSLAAKDKYANGVWANTLKALSDQGHLSRSRLLDACLNTLEQDFAQFRASWFSRFFTSLEPTLDELASRANSLMLLLGSQIPPTVSFALKNLNILEKKQLLDVEVFLTHVEAPLQANTKATIMLALRILTSLAKRHSNKAAQIALHSAGAIIFDNGDVQKKVFDIIDKYGIHGDQALMNTLQLNVDFVVPSLKNRLEPWLGSDAIEDEIDDDVGPQVTDERQNRYQEITPIKSFETLIVEFSQLLESPNDPIQIERVLDALSRLGRIKPDNSIVLLAPLKKRALQLEQRSSVEGVARYLAMLAVSYTSETNLFKVLYSKIVKERSPQFDDVFFARLYFLVEGILRGGEGCSLISAPTHGRGFINPNVLALRARQMAAQNADFSSIDKALAIMRIDTSILNEAQTANVVGELCAISCEFSLACAYALGADVAIGGAQALWIAAACTNTPNATDKRLVEKFGKLGPNAGVQPDYQPWVEVRKTDNYCFYDLKVEKSVPVPASIAIDQIGLLFHRVGRGNYYDNAHFDSDEALVKWGSTLWPANLEPYFCCGACEIDITWAEAQWHVQSFFEPLLDSAVPLKPMALLLIVAGLSSKEPGQKGIAMDIVIMSIDDGRMDINKLAGQMSVLMTTGIITVSRWTKILKEISTVSNRHGKAMRLLIQSLFRFNPEDSPRELGGLIELLYELSVASKTKVTDTQAIEFFTVNNKGGKQAKFAKKLLAL